MGGFTTLVCDYIDKEKAKEENTVYYCDYDKMGFDDMTAHCQHCEIYDALMKRAYKLIFGNGYDG